jgi:transcriptional regulator with XRE-family HTH domain
MLTNLKEIRGRTGKTQQQVADEIGIKRWTYINWEQGKTELDGKKLKLLSQYFDVSIDAILGIDEAVLYERAGFSPDEQQLIFDYRSLSDQGREYIRQTVAMALNTYRLPEKNIRVASVEAA